MIAESDIIRLPYTPDLSEGGSAYACRWLAGTFERMGESPAERMRRSAAEAAAELAFRRFLSMQNVPFAVQEGSPFNQPEHTVLLLGGHRCELISYLISRPNQLVQLRQDPGSLLQAPALIPLDQFAAERHQPDDLYVFAFLAGGVAASQEDIQCAAAAGESVHLMKVLPEGWRRPSAWHLLERLALKSECAETMIVEIGGLDALRGFVTETCELPPLTRVAARQEFNSLAYMRSGSLPEKRLGLHSPRHGEAYIIQPYDWGNIRIRGEQILLAGWLTHEEFRNKAVVLNAGQPTFQFVHTHTRNLLVQVDRLNPLGGLLEKVRSWEAQKIRPASSS